MASRLLSRSKTLALALSCADVAAPSAAPAGARWLRTLSSLPRDPAVAAAPAPRQPTVGSPLGLSKVDLHLTTFFPSSLKRECNVVVAFECPPHRCCRLERSPCCCSLLPLATIGLIHPAADLHAAGTDPPPCCPRRCRHRSAPCRVRREGGLGGGSLSPMFGDDGYEHTYRLSGTQVLPRWFSTGASNGSSAQQGGAATKVTAFSPLEASIGKPRSGPLTSESSKVRRSELLTQATFYMIPTLLLVSKNSISTSLLVASVFHQVYMFYKEIFLDYVHHDITRKWVLIYFKLLLIIMAKETIVYFDLF
ncbi:hypothetical protein ABZP36_014649 [Zizania latifolia]